MGHSKMYVCLPVEEAKTSLQARRRVCRYLTNEHFVQGGRFCGICDYFSVGGASAGLLNQLRIKHDHPRKFKQFLRKLDSTEPGTDSAELFKDYFPDYVGMNPFDRPEAGFYGHSDDAQIMDEALFAELKNGFWEYVSIGDPLEDPCVIFTDEFELKEYPEDAKSAGRYWVVVIDYHA